MRCREQYVLLTDADKVMNIDYADIIAFHEQKGADITAVYREEDLTEIRAAQAAVYSADSGGRITAVQLYPRLSGKAKVCQKIFVLSRELLIGLVVDAVSSGKTSFHGDILRDSCDTLKIYGYLFKGYSATIDSLAAYYSSSMDLLSRNVLDDVFGGAHGRLVYTKVRDSVPSKYFEGASTANSLIADGCEIHGSVENSIIFRGVKVGRGAKIKDSVIMQDSVIGENASLSCVITDKNVYIGDRRTLAGCETLPYFVGKNMRL